MGLCIRPFGIILAGDRACHARHDRIKDDKREDREDRIDARLQGDGVGAFEGVVTSIVENDPLGKLFQSGSDIVSGIASAFGGKKDPATGATDPMPMMLAVGAVGVVGAVIFATHKTKKGGH